jgi:hypothetical protein
MFKGDKTVQLEKITPLNTKKIIQEPRHLAIKDCSSPIPL